MVLRDNDSKSVVFYRVVMVCLTNFMFLHCSDSADCGETRALWYIPRD
jgi:hypothetical protein